MFTLVNGSCPLTAVEWTNLETAYCKDGGKYHCIPNENGQLGQVCTSPMWIQSNFCPEYNTVAKKLDVRLCDFKLGECPFTTYLSNTVYEYIACFPVEENKETTAQFTSSGPQTSTEMTSSDKVTSDVNVPVGIILLVFFIALLVAAVLLGIFFYRRKCRRRYGKNKHDYEPDTEKQEETYRMMAPKPCSEIQNHKDDTTFYPQTRAAEMGWKVLSNYRVLILVGLPGAGKTKLGLEMGRSFSGQLINGKHCVFKLTKDMKNLEHKIESDLQTCFFLDDCFETWNYTQQESTSAKNAELGHLTAFYENYIKKHSHVSIIITVGLTTWNRFSGVFKASSIFVPEHIIPIQYDNIDKKAIFRKHATASGLVIADKSECSLPEYTNIKAVSEYILQGNVGNQNQTDDTESTEETYDYIISDGTDIASIPGKDVKEIMRADSETLGFPEACALFCHDKVLWQKGSKFFEKPMQYLKGRFEGMLGSRETLGKARICALFYTLLSGRDLNVNNLNKKLLNEIANLCTLDVRSEDLIGKSVQYLSGSYLTEMFHGNFVFQHDVIEFVVLNLLYEKNAEMLLRLCPARALQRYVRTSTYKKDESEMVLKITSQHTETLAKRLADDSCYDKLI